MRKRLARAVWVLALATACGRGSSSSSDDRLTGAEKGRYDQRAAMELASMPEQDEVGNYMMQPPIDGVPQPAPGKDGFRDYGVNPFVDAAADRLSTFAIDVDTASYAIARRKIMAGEMPPPEAVRVEEFVNYFKWNYPGPTGAEPFAVHMDMAPSPLTAGRHLLRVGVQAKKVALRDRKPAHLTFLVDVSGSMSGPDRLELAKRSLRILVDNLRDGDTVALVTYAGSTRVVLEPTDISRKAEIVSAIEELSSGGSTAMGSGIELAYKQAGRMLSANSISRVIVLSDGDANVGNTTHEQILGTIAGHVKEGVTLTTVGFGMGNYKDETMEQLANKGNGNNYYIDNLNQAKRVFQEQLGGTLEVVAKDVKLQLDFDPTLVKRYRLVGYENRDIADQDFRNDKVDAGEIGAGHTVTALYELELASALPANLKPADLGKLATLRIRHKTPSGTQASEASFGFDSKHQHARFDDAPADLRFATAVMAAAEILRKSEHAGSWKLDQVLAIARAAAPADSAERQEFLSLLERMKPLTKVAARDR